jgi:hypothetical protein
MPQGATLVTAVKTSRTTNGHRYHQLSLNWICSLHWRIRTSPFLPSRLAAGNISLRVDVTTASNMLTRA